LRRKSDVPVIGLSLDYNPDVKMEFLRLRCDQFVQKPVLASELVLRISNALHRVGKDMSGPHTLLRFNVWTLTETAG
jgi:DNA-binding response OmpR family regulator